MGHPVDAGFFASSREKRRYDSWLFLEVLSLMSYGDKVTAFINGYGTRCR
jgi:hypothetical protein